MKQFVSTASGKRGPGVTSASEAARKLLFSDGGEILARQPGFSEAFDLRGRIAIAHVRGIRMTSGFTAIRFLGKYEDRGWFGQ